MREDKTPQPVDLADFDFLANVEIGILAELDGRKISFRELLQLEVGNTLPLSRAVGENIDVYVDRVLLGTGEVLVVDDSLAVRMADLRDKASAPKPLAPVENEATVSA